MLYNEEINELKNKSIHDETIADETGVPMGYRHFITWELSDYTAIELFVYIMHYNKPPFFELLTMMIGLQNRIYEKWPNAKAILETTTPIRLNELCIELAKEADNNDNSYVPINVRHFNTWKLTNREAIQLFLILIHCRESKHLLVRLSQLKRLLIEKWPKMESAIRNANEKKTVDQLYKELLNIADIEEFRLSLSERIFRFFGKTVFR